MPTDSEPRFSFPKVQKPMTAFSTQKLRRNHGRKRNCKQRLSRLIRLEQLERRELMASDLTPFHNGFMPKDVDGDFQVSPLDALIVINSLNSMGSGSLIGQTPSNGRTNLIDTDGDNALSPLDALNVINALNAEGEPIDPDALVKYEFYTVNADGSAGTKLVDPTPGNGVNDVRINTGEKFIVRTLMSDNRNIPTGGGVFSAYHDFDFKNMDPSSTEEKMELQWSDYNQLEIIMQDLGNGKVAFLSGSFKLQYGSERTAAIQIAKDPADETGRLVDPEGTRKNIQTELEKLSVIGAGNVTVRLNLEQKKEPGYRFDIFFRNERARQDIVKPTVEEESFTVSQGNLPTTAISDIVNPNPSNTLAVRGSLNFVYLTADNQPENPLYVNGPGGSLNDLSGGGRRISVMGGFINTSTPTGRGFRKVVDTTFKAAKAGDIKVQGKVSPLPTGSDPSAKNLGIAFFGTNSYLNESQVSFADYVVSIVDRLSAVNDSFPSSVSEDNPANLNVGGNDFERDNLPFGIVEVTQPTNGSGTVSFVAGGAAKSVLFTPAPNYFGPASFTYKIRSSRGDEATATVTLDVLPVNDPPVVVNLSYNATEDQAGPLVITPANVFSPGPANESSQTVSLSIVTAPTASQGTATVNTTTGNLEFIPATDFFGTVNIVVRGTDSGPNSPAPNSNNTVATLTINVSPVNDAPVIGANSFSMDEDAATPLTITPAELFAPGPANESSQTITLQILSGPTSAQGNASIVNGSLRFSPAKDFFGPVSMTVRGTDNGIPPESTDSTFTINVNNVNDPPIATDDQASVIALGDPNTLNVLSNDLPGPGGEPGTITVVSVTGVTPSNAGTVQVAAGGTGVVFTPSTSPSLFGTTATFNYTINDQAGLPATAKVTVTILPPASPYAVDDDYRSNLNLVINEDTSATLDVLANDFSKGTKSLTVGTNPSQPRIISGPGSVAIEGNLIRYTPEADRFGEVVFTYAMDDTDTTPEANERRVATATILVKAVNDAPVAVNQLIPGVEDTAQDVNLADLDLSSGPFENDKLVFISPTLTTPDSGSISFTAGTGTFRYVPAKDFFGLALVTYSVRDDGTPAETSNTATITIDVAPVNDPPIANAYPVQTVAESTPTTPTSLSIEIESLRANAVAGPANEIAPPQSQTVSFDTLTGTPGSAAGTFLTAKGGTVRRDGANLIYTPATSYNSVENRGPDSFTYQIKDSLGATALGTVTINVTEVNDPPETKTEPSKRLKVQVYAGVPTIINLTNDLLPANWSRGAANESNQTLVLKEIVSPPNVGTVSNLQPTQFVYASPLNTDVTTLVTFRVEDNGTTAEVEQKKTAEGIIEIQVLPFQPSSFRGTVFIDDDADGLLDRSGNDLIETPIGGVEVTLTFMDPLTSTMKSVTEMTAADGSYDFDFLPPAQYTISYSTPLYMMNGPSNPMSFTKNVVAPGGVNTVFDFPVQGVTSEYITYLDLLASAYNQNDPTRRRGLLAAVKPDGSTDWSTQYGKQNTGIFYEVVLSQDMSEALLTEISANGSKVRTTVVGRRDFSRIGTTDGGQMVRIMKDPSEITNWTEVKRSNPITTARGYLKTVDEFFAQEGWHFS
jgi:hypothetical protein